MISPGYMAEASIVSMGTTIAVAGTVDRHMRGDTLVDLHEGRAGPSDLAIRRLDNIPGSVRILRPKLDRRPGCNPPKDTTIVHRWLFQDVRRLCDDACQLYIARPGHSATGSRQGEQNRRCDERANTPNNSHGRLLWLRPGRDRLYT